MAVTGKGNITVHEHLHDISLLTDETAKKKFKNLRDQFRLELKKVPAGRVGDPSLPLQDYLSSWPWFKMMFFLKDKIHKRMTNTTPTGVSIKRNCDEMEFTQSEVFDEDNPGTQDSQDAPHSDTLNDQFKDPMAREHCLKRMKECTLQSDFLAIEKQRLELLKRQADEESDSDRMFLLSLLPAMKTLGPRRSQLFRLKVQQLLYDSQYSQDFDQ